jgi:Protein of unknown function (DUF4236)
MGLRFRRSLKLLPGVRINLSGSGASVSLGARGFHYTIGPRGTRVTAGLPGTGLSWTQFSPYASNSPTPGEASPPQPNLSPIDQHHHDSLQAIQNSSANEINSFSTSELAPILNSANRRLRLAPAVQLLCILLFVATLLQPNHQSVGVSALFATIFVPIAIFLDRYRRSVKVAFESEGLVARIAEALSVAFAELTQSEAIWIVHAEGRTSDWKRNAGATSLTRRAKTKLRFSKPHCIRGSAKLPSFQVGSDEIYLLPDAALIIVNGQVASVAYRELDFSMNVVRFIEDGRVPSDTTVADYTWRYVNKSGAPDRRFVNNIQLPVCLYGELAFRSTGGLNSKLELSKPSAAEPLRKVISALKQTAVELPKSATYVRTSQSWPTFAFLSIFGSLAILQAAFLSQSTFRKFDNSGTPQPWSAAPGISAKVGSQDAQKTSIPGNSNVARSQPAGAPLELEPPSVAPSPQQLATSSQQALDLNDADNLRWVQSRLQSLGYLRAGSRTWDSSSRSALRDFKTTNNLGTDDKWDYRTEDQLASGSAVRAEQTFVGSWSEGTCEPNLKPDIVINSRRAVSSTGGVCEFFGFRQAGSSWNVATTCSNGGEKWSANIKLAISNGKLVWMGRDGTATEYSRCR